jgi:hypothetical protein
VPHHTNNQRARLLKHDALLLISCILLFFSFLLPRIETVYPGVLGAHINVTLQDLLLHTNQKRIEAGLAPLSLSQELSRAAQMKAEHMLDNNYWAHFAPDGTSPWIFIRESGYDYTYAGENLARGFTTSADAVAAWMASPDHRANMLSSQFSEVGFAVVEGALTGEKRTVLIVEMFGKRNSIPQQANQSAPLVPQAQAAVQLGETGIQRSAVVDSQSFARQVAMFLLGGFIVLFALDLLLISRKRIARLVGHNVDHILYLGAMTCVAFIMLAGSII